MSVEAAKRALASLDLTNLNEDCDADDIRNLCARAQTPHGPVAAVCIWPQHVAQAKMILAATPVRVATVVNFPQGDHPASEVIALTEQAVADGADEIDMVIPYKALLEGHPENVPARVARVKEAADGKRVKAILETGVLKDAELIAQAAKLAIDGGADFIKTSTGKVTVNATLISARIMLRAIAEHDPSVGFKPAGGVKTTDDAEAYLALCDEILGPDWVSPQTFRIGASGVLDALLATLDGREGAVAEGGY
ncbi:MAG: deoxyribose-phosphate aldolase [Pseudomonadota bacterium]